MTDRERTDDAMAWARRLTEGALVRGRSFVGEIEVVHCTDGSFRMDGGAMFGVVPKTMWETKAPADERNRVLLGTNCAVVRTGRHTVVVETGIGNKQTPKMRSIFENKELLPASLRAAGIAPETVDYVVNTHLHFDHCGWNTTMEADGTVRPTFPNALYVAAAGEVEHSRLRLERDAVSYIPEHYEPLVATGQMRLVSTEALGAGVEVCPGVRLELWPGHTAQMVGVHLESRAAGGRTAMRGCYIGDLLPTSAHLQPTWGMAFDLDPLRVIEERKRFYARAVPEAWTVLFPHDHGMPAARLVLDDAGRLQAVPTAGPAEPVASPGA